MYDLYCTVPRRSGPVLYPYGAGKRRLQGLIYKYDDFLFDLGEVTDVKNIGDLYSVREEEAILGRGEYFHNSNSAFHRRSSKVSWCDVSIVA